MVPIAFRPPTFSKTASPLDFPLPTIAWLTETWHVTHSTLPMWKSKRNVRIKYTPLPPSDPSIPAESTDRLDDLVMYQSLTGSDKVSTVEGVDKAASEGRGEWDWRGKGWLRVASSHWEVLAWGEEGGGNKWAVTMFAKTMFTPAGIDLYSRDGEGVAPETLEGIKKGLAEVEDEDVRRMASELFEVKVDGTRGE